jgi:hypothetical protein
MGLETESKDIPISHIDFYRVALTSSSAGVVITELALKGEGVGHVPTCWNTQ